MKRSNISRGALLIAGAAIIGSLLGCVTKESLVTREVASSGKDWVKNETTQEYRDVEGKRIKDKQVIYEKIKCVAKNGKTIKATTVEECIKLGGKIVDEVITEEQTIRNR